MVLFLAGDLFNEVTTFTCGFVGFDAAAVRRMISYVHGTTAARLYAGDVFMLKGLNESLMGGALLL
jgi:hypothetical protein